MHRAGNYQSSAQYLGILFLTFWILLSYLVPISLFVTMEIVKFVLARPFPREPPCGPQTGRRADRFTLQGVSLSGLPAPPTYRLHSVAPTARRRPERTSAAVELVPCGVAGARTAPPSCRVRQRVVTRPGLRRQRRSTSAPRMQSDALVR
jgi:hypothetical protein